MNILETYNLTKRFGGLVAVNQVSIQVPEGSIISIIGPNGAGKTTFFNCISGFYAPDEGNMIFDGKTSVSMDRSAGASMVAFLFSSRMRR